MVHGQTETDMENNLRNTSNALYALSHSDGMTQCHATYISGIKHTDMACAFNAMHLNTQQRMCGARVLENGSLSTFSEFNAQWQSLPPDTAYTLE